VGSWVIVETRLSNSAGGADKRLRMKAMGKELGNGGIILLEGYMVNQWSFAGDVDRDETIRSERGWGDVGIMRW
jgi:hypothetical protein